MKKLIVFFLVSMTTWIRAGMPSGPAYDLYLYHGKSQLDYEGSGSRNHGRTQPYTYLGSVTSWAMTNGATVTFRGNEARVVKHNTDEPCEIWEDENGNPDLSRWLYSRAKTADIGIAFPNQFNADPAMRWEVNCVQKIDADPQYGDDTHAAAGIIAVRRDLSNYHRDTFAAHMIAEQERIGVPPLAMDWMIREVTTQAAENLFPGAISEGTIVITPVVINRHWQDPEPAEGNPVHGQNLSLEVTVPLNKHVAPGAVPGAWLEPIGAVYVGDASLNARLYLGQNAYIRVYADEIGSGFSLEDALYVTERDTVHVVEENGKTYVYTGPFKVLDAQTGATNHVAVIESGGNNLSIELYPAAAPYDPDKPDELAYLAGSGTPMSTLAFVQNGQTVQLTYQSTELEGTATFESVTNGWKTRHQINGTDYNRAVQTTAETLSGGDVRVTRLLLDELNATLETSVREYRNFQQPEGYTHEIPIQWDENNIPDMQSHVFENVDDWRVTRILEGVGAEQRVTLLEYETSGAAFGKLRQITGPDGEWAEFRYDAQGRLEKHLRVLAGVSVGASLEDHRVTEYVYTGTSLIPSEILEKKGGVEVGKTTLSLANGVTTVNVIQPAGPGGQSGFNLPYTTRYQYGFLHNTVSPSGQVVTQSTSLNMDTLTVETASGAPADGTSGFQLAVAQGLLTEDRFSRSVQAPIFHERRWLENGEEIYLQTIAEGSISHDGRGRVTAMTSTNGVQGTETVTYGYHGPTSHTDRFGRTTSHVYQPHGQLTATLFESEQINHVHAPTGARVYSYPAVRPDGAPPDITSAGILEKRVDPMARATHFSRNLQNGIINLQTTLPTGAVAEQALYPDGLPKSTGGSALPEMTFEYQWGQNQIPLAVTQSYTANPDENVVRAYDFLGRLTTVSRPSPSGTGNVETKYHYHPQTGLLEKISRSHGADTLYSYDALNRIHRVVLDVNGNGEVDLGGPDQVIEWKYEMVTDDFGVFGFDKPAMKTTEYIYPGDHDAKVTHSVSMSSLDGLNTRSQRLDLPEATRVTTVQNAEFTTVHTHADGTTTTEVVYEGLLRSRGHKDAVGTQISAQTFEYTNRQLDTLTDTGRGKTEYDYYPDGALMWVMTPEDDQGVRQTVFYDYSAPGGLPYEQNGMVRVTTLTDGTSTITEKFTPRGQLRSRTGALGYPVAYTYDHAGRLLTQTTWRDQTQTQNGAVTQWEYNNAGLLHRKIHPAANDILEYTYHSNGVPHTETLARGLTKTYATNVLGQITGISYNDSTPPVTYAFDRLGRVDTISDASGLRKHQYRPHNLLLETISYQSGPLDGHNLQFNQDNLHRLISVNVRNETDTLHSNAYEYDPASRVKWVTGNEQWHEHTYAPDRGAELQSIKHRNGAPSNPHTLETTFQIDNLGRLTHMAHTGTSGVAASHTYTHNALNQREQHIFSDGTRWTYTYDNLGQIHDATKRTSDDIIIPGYSFSYNFDDIGNRKTFEENTRTTTYTANNLNQYSHIDRPAFAHLRGDRDNINTSINVELLGGPLGPQEATYSYLLWYKEKEVVDPVSTFTITATEGGNSNSVTGSLYTPHGETQPQHDIDGNQTQDHLWVYTWDAENRLIQQEHRGDINISPLQSTRIEHAYDSQGRRFRMTVSRWDAAEEAYVTEEDVLYVNHDWNPLVELLDDGEGQSLLRTHTWGLDLSGSFQGAGGVGGLLNTRHHGTTQTTAFPLADGNGNITAYANHSDATLIAYFDYAPFGQTLRASGPAANLFPHRFATKPQCPESGHLYFGHRHLNPEIGAWLSRDPIGESGGLNLYGYANNDPINGFDVLGLKVKLESIVIREGQPNEMVKFELWDRFRFRSDVLIDIAYVPSEYADQFRRNFNDPDRINNYPYNFWVSNPREWEKLDDDGIMHHHPGMPQVVVEAQHSGLVWHNFTTGEIRYARGQDSLPVMRTMPYNNFEKAMALTFSPLSDLNVVLSQNSNEFTDQEIQMAQGRLTLTIGLWGISKTVKGISLLDEIPAAGRGGRAPIFADNNVLVAAERGNAAALAEIRAGKTFVTPNQLREFINPAAIPGHQLATRRALLQAEGIQVYGGSSAAQAAAGSNFQNVFRATTAGQHGRADAALGAFARETGFEAVTMERRITNFFNLTRPELQVPIRRVTPQ